MSNFDTEGFSADYDACVASGDTEAIEWLESNYDAYFNDEDDE